MVDVQEVIRQPESAYAEVLHINPVTDDEIFEDGDLVWLMEPLHKLSSYLVKKR